MFTNIKIGVKVTILLLAVVSLSVFSISFLSYNQSKTSTEQQYAQIFNRLADQKVKSIGNYFKGLESDLDLMSMTEEVGLSYQIVANMNLSDLDSIYNYVNQKLDAVFLPIQKSRSFANIVLTNTLGRVIYKSNRSASWKTMVVGSNDRMLGLILRAAEKSGKEIYYSKPLLEQRGALDGRPIIGMYVVKLLKDAQGTPIGNLITLVDISGKIYPQLRDYTVLGNTGEIILCRISDSGGSIEYLNSLRNKPDAALFSEIHRVDNQVISTEQLALGILGSKGDSSSMDEDNFVRELDYREKEVISVGRNIPYVNWGLIIKIDEDEIRENLAELVQVYSISGGVIIFLSFLIAIIFSRIYLINPIISLKSRLQLVSQGILPEIKKNESKDELGEMADALNGLVKALKRTAGFADQIGQGNYAASFSPMSNDDSLGNALLSMRDSIQHAEQRDSERTWIVSGVAEIGQILRLNTGLEDLGQHVVSYMSDKINAVQGAFYVTDHLEDDDPKEPILVMKASYAYNKKKYIKSSFKFSEGLVGQAAIEQDIIIRTEIPSDYVSITSGILGDKKPSCILIYPLITNEKVYGVLEFAGFEKFTDVHIEFVKEISVILAQTIFNVKVNGRTYKLLQESQQMSEELQFQQEILRQNAEEMESTQEELKRTNQRLEDQILEVNRSQKRLQVLLENASEVITIYEKDGIVRYVSPSVEPILGYTPEDMIGVNDIVNVHPDSTQKYVQFFNKLLNEPQKRHTIQFEYRQVNGNTIWLEATGTNLLSDMAIQGIVINTRDITERRRAEREERMRGQMQALSENSPDLITRLNLDGIFFYINPVIETLTGSKSQQYLSKHYEEVNLDNNVVSIWRSLIGEVKSSKVEISKEMTFPGILGNRVMRVNAIPEFTEEQILESVLIVSHDITESKEIELEIRNTNRKITESINYARRIQSAILPSTYHIQKVLPDSFIFYRPRDLVSGDFPWFIRKGDDIYIAAVDCTGHGVPGALISLIGYFILNDITNRGDIIHTGEILYNLNLGVTKTLKQDEENSTTRDGMDIALMRVNFKENIVEYSGANRPLYYYSNNELIQIKGDRKPIGGGKHYKKNQEFKSHQIEIQPQDEFYMFSDGLPDQFGGELNKKFAPRKIRDIITRREHNNMNEIKHIFEHEFEDWKGDKKQTDDILMIGIKFQ